jgi:hypothetical protein
MIVDEKKFIGQHGSEVCLHSTFPQTFGRQPCSNDCLHCDGVQQSGFGSGREMTSGQQVSYVFCIFRFSFLLSNEIETGIMFNWSRLLNSELFICS